MHGRNDVIATLLKHNLDINIQNKKKESPLHLAADSSHLDTVKFLVEKVRVQYNNDIRHLPKQWA
jgi:ankyrin repeat protein